MSMETDRWTNRMGTEPMLPIKWTVTISTMLYFDGDGHGHGDGTCKQVITSRLSNTALEEMLNGVFIHA